MSELAAIVEVLNAKRAAPAALATLVSVEGSSYRRPGARLLVHRDGASLGSISGGCLEADLKEHAQRVLEDGQARTVEYDTTTENDLVWGVGLGCQGVVRVFIEKIPVETPAWVGAAAANLAARRATTLEVHFAGASPAGTRLAEASSPAQASDGCFRQTIPAAPALVVFGAGDDAQPLARFAKMLGWHVVVADARAAYATAERFPAADRLCVAPVAEQVGQLGLDQSWHAVVMTHRYRDDLALLRELLPCPLAYLGLLGPRKRTARLLAELKSDGLVPDESMLAKLHAPVGLDLGGDGPEVVALAIVAEIQARMAGRAAGFLKDRQGPIHG